MPTGDGVIEVVVTNSLARTGAESERQTLWPVPGANSVTDASGKALFERLPDGEFKVRADHPSFPRLAGSEDGCSRPN